MTSMRQGVPGSTTTSETADMTDNTCDNPGPPDEATSAADADWLAELRATAKERNTSLADVVTDRETDVDAEIEAEIGAEIEIDVGPDDDESTIGSPTALDDIRRVAREERERATAAAQLSDVGIQPPAATVVPNRPVQSAPPKPDLRPTVRPDIPSAPPALRGVGPDLSPGRVEPRSKADQVAPRWEAPPRLEAAADSSEPAFLDRSGSTGKTDWRITALAVTAAVLLGVVLSLLFLNNDAPSDPLDEDPDGTTVIEGSIANDAEQPEVGS